MGYPKMTDKRDASLKKVLDKIDQKYEDWQAKRDEDKQERRDRGEHRAASDTDSDHSLEDPLEKADAKARSQSFKRVQSKIRRNSKVDIPVMGSGGEVGFL